MTRSTRKAPSRTDVSYLTGAPVAYRSLADQIASSIREAIAQGKIPPGARLLEPSLAKEMGTSRAPVREAIAELEREGLVVKEANRGARVAELTEQTVREVAEVRGLLEGAAASLAAERLTPADLEALEALAAGMRDAARRGEYGRLVELDYQFHATICRASGHRVLYETWVAISGKVRLYLSATNLVYPNQQDIAHGHRAILDAIRAKSKERAHRAMQEHLGEMLNLFVAKVIRKATRSRAGRRSTSRDGKRPAGEPARRKRGGAP
jgi:DNA-binding GntR family transcriptional regulator